MTLDRTAILMSFAYLAACPRPSSTGSEQGHSLTGTVIASNGNPASGAVVIITDIATTNEIAFARTDSLGHFALNSPVREVALTGVSSVEWSFLAKVDVLQGD